MYEHINYCSAGKFVSHGEWMHPDRVINSYEIIFVISGTVYIDESGTQYELKKNDMLLLEPKRQHYGYKKSCDTSFFWLHFTGEINIDANCKYKHIPENYNLSLLFKQILHYRAEKRSDESLDYLTRLIIMECFSVNKKLETNRIAAEAEAWITANRDIKLKAEQVAEHFGYNVDYLCRVFKASYGRSIKEHIDSVKINHIKSLLLTSDMTLTDIAYNTGFTSYKYFLKFFKYHEGITPTEFLKIYPKTHINKS